MKFVVKTTEVAVKSGIGKSGRPYELHEQAVYFETEDERRKIRVTLATGQTPYAPGEYVMDPRSFVVDQYGALGLKLALLPAARAQVKAA